MANIKISELNEATSVNNEDLLMVVQNNENKKVPAQLLKPYFLYNGNASSTSITLSDSVANYRFIEIFFQSENIYGSKKVYAPNGKRVFLNVDVLFADANYFKNSKWLITGSSINLEAGNGYTINANGLQDFDDATNNVYITTVVGYK